MAGRAQPVRTVEPIVSTAPAVAAVGEAAAARAAKGERRGEAAGDRAEAVSLLAAADARDHADEVTTEQLAGSEDRADAEHAYDSAERREALAESLHGVGNREAMEARVRADAAQARPATAAVTSSTQASRPRRTRHTATTGRTVQRSDRGL